MVAIRKDGHLNNGDIMAKAKGTFGVNNFRGNRKKGRTSISKRRKTVKFSTMNKSKKRSWKEYRGQGK